jgi:hypothetical protein
MKWRQTSQAILLLLLLVICTTSTAEVFDPNKNSPRQSNFALKSSVIGAAGYSGASSNYQTIGTLGQSTPIGISSGSDKTLYGGFWSAFQRLSWLTHIPLPEIFSNRLFQNFPNPFNPLTTIQYEVAQRSPVRVTIIDVRGMQVRKLINDFQPPGKHKILWDGRDDRGQLLASGVYFYRLRIGDFQSVKKMLLLK